MKTNYTSVVTKAFFDALERFKMLDGATDVVVGFSGGADSVCLLHLLSFYAGKLGINVVASHINHGIRGDEALRDQQFAEAFCNRLGIPFRLLSVNCVQEAEKSKESVEECGRRLRYDFFNSLCLSASYKIATAHNSNDNAETLLFNLTRGTSLKGCGIPPVRDNIIRPLILCSREAIEGYCKENHLEYMTDSTNLSDDYTRNNIRHNVLPVLCNINPSFLNALSGFCEDAGSVDLYLDKRAEEVLNDSRMDTDSYSVDVLLSADECIVKRVIIKAFSHFTAHTLDRNKINGIYSLLSNGGRLQIYGNFFAGIYNGCLRFYEEDSDYSLDVPVNSLPCECDFCNIRLSVSEFTNCSKKVPSNLLDNLIDCDKIVGQLHFRSKQEGDTVTLRKRNVTKTLKKLFIEARIPREVRHKIPVLCDDNGVVWVYGFGVNKKYSVDDTSSHIILVRGNDNDR